MSEALFVADTDEAVVVRVPALDGSTVFYELTGRALVLAADGSSYRASLGREVTFEHGMAVVDWNRIGRAHGTTSGSITLRFLR